MVTVRRAADRGQAHHGWLNSYHSFSFGDYYDPRYLGISNLRVINDDTVAPGGGFATHGHQDMEIVSVVLSGVLEHKDSLGHGSAIHPGDVQLMSAGSGIRHSEFNASAVAPVHFLQIWLEPNRPGVTPGYAQRHYPEAERRGRLRLLVSPDGRDDSIAAHQDGLLYGALLESGQCVEQALDAGRRGYVQVALGSVVVNGQTLNAGDGARIDDEAAVAITGSSAAAQVLFFDLP